MPVSTYDALASVTISSAQSTVTFSNIPQTYTDLILVMNGATSVSANVRMRFNADDRTYYSTTALSKASGASATYSFNQTYLACDVQAYYEATPYAMKTIQIFNYASSAMFKTILVRSGDGSLSSELIAGTYRSTAAINSLTFILSSGTFSAGSTFNLYGVGATTLKATGGNIITTDGTYWYHAFTSSGTFTPQSALSCDVLAVAGGGGGGRDAGGGGGAGGVFYATSQSLSSAQTVVVGGGGLGAVSYSAPAPSGSNSTFGSLTAAVGGGGGSTVYGGNGGSGGGAGRGQGAAGTSTQTGTGGTGYGFAGGSSTGTGNAGAGGGGAGAAGTAITSGTQAKAGGVGLTTWSQWLITTGLSLPSPQAGYIAGGGGGGGNSDIGGVGGLGGGGTGGSGSLVYAVAGLPNTGGGGGGSSGGAGGRAGANGGSGLVIVRYAV